MPSSVIRAIHYDPGSTILRVVFMSGKVYDYKKVPESVYLELKAAPSKGTYLNREIKNKYSFVKVK